MSCNSSALDDDVFVRMPDDMWKSNSVKATKFKGKETNLAVADAGGSPAPFKNAKDRKMFQKSSVSGLDKSFHGDKEQGVSWLSLV